MKQLVRLRIRPSRDGRKFVYFLDYVDEDSKRRRISLGNADKRKAERQRAQKERELRMGVVAPESMKLSDFLEDSLARTGSQIRESTAVEYRSAMLHFIDVVGDIDYQAVRFRHGEVYLQACLDRGDSPATAGKKLRHLKRLFQLAVDRSQLEENPLKRIKQPRVPKRTIRIYTADECERILKSAQQIQNEAVLRWDLLIIVALVTGMRKSELLNAVWSDIDFEAKTIQVSPKSDTDETWEWRIKDTDCRTLPVIEDVIDQLAEHQSRQPENYPYVFVSPDRYDHIQELRKQGKWTFTDARLSVINNFKRHFDNILRRASVEKGRFHDLRSTALTNWFAMGMSEYDVMHLAGHSKFETTHRFYLTVAADLVDRARQASAKAFGKNLAHIWHAPPQDANMTKGRQAQVLASPKVT